MENLDRDLEREYTREELESFLKHNEFLVERAKEQIKELDEKEVELNKEYVVEIPEQGLYLINEGTMLEEYTQEYLDCEGWNIDILNKLGDIRTNPESAWVSARRNIRANRLEALAHSIGGAYESEFRKDNYYIYVCEDGTFHISIASCYLEPEKIYMTKETAEKVCEILNSGRYKLNVDVAVEEDYCEEDYCEEDYIECPCCAWQGNDC